MSLLTRLLEYIRSLFQRNGDQVPDTYDPTDDQDEPAEVTDVDDADPVDLIPGDASEEAPVPTDWGSQLTDEDLAERLDGVDLTPDPEDGRQEETP